MSKINKASRLRDNFEIRSVSRDQGLFSDNGRESARGITGGEEVPKSLNFG